MTQRFAIYGNRDVDVPTVLHPDLEYPGLVRGLVGAWSPCLGNTGGKLMDYSGRGNHGTLTNMTPATDWVNFQGRLALNSDAGLEKVEAANVSGLPTATTAAFSLSFWHRTRTFISLSHVFGFGPQLPASALNNAGRYVLQYLSNYYFWTGPTDWDTGIAWDTDAVWHHIVFSYKPTTMTLYRDGVERASTSFTPLASAGTYVTLFSQHTSAASSSDILLSDCIINSSGYTALEAKLLYSLGPGGWAIPRQRRWNALGAAQLAQAAYVVGGGIAVPGGVN